MLGLSAMPAVDDDDIDHRPVGDVVSVKGVLQPFQVAQFERLAGELDDAAYRRFEGQPALIVEVMRSAG